MSTPTYFCWNLFSFVFISWNLLCNLCDFFYNLLFSLGLAPMSVPSFPLTCFPCIFFIFGREHSVVTFSSLLFFYLTSLLGNKVVWNLLCYFCSKPLSSHGLARCPYECYLIPIDLLSLQNFHFCQGIPCCNLFLHLFFFYLTSGSSNEVVSKPLFDRWCYILLSIIISQNLIELYFATLPTLSLLFSFFLALLFFLWHVH